MNPSWVAIAIGAVLNIAAFAYGYGRLSTRVEDAAKEHTKFSLEVNARFDHSQSEVSGRLDRIQADVREIRSLFLKANGDAHK